MDILILLDKLDDLIYSSKPIPLTDQVRVEREEVYSLLDQIRVTLPEEIKQARWIVKERKNEDKERGQEAPQPRNGQPEDERLRELVDSIAELKRAQRPAPPPLTAAAAEKVRSIIEAAEASAAEIRAEAEREAQRIEGDAARRGMEMRQRSSAEAAARLKRADEVTAALLAEAGSASADIEAMLDRVRGPAAALADALGDGAEKVQADFARIRARVAEAPFDGVPEISARDLRRASDDQAVDQSPSEVEGVGEHADESHEPTPGEHVDESHEPTPGDISRPTEEWSAEEALAEDHARG